MATIFDSMQTFLVETRKELEIYMTQIYPTLLEPLDITVDHKLTAKYSQLDTHYLTPEGMVLITPTFYMEMQSGKDVTDQFKETKVPLHQYLIRKSFDELKTIAVFLKDRNDNENDNQEE